MQKKTQPNFGFATTNSEIISSISPEKDVDGLHPRNFGLLLQGKPNFIPCTPYGCLHILKYYNIDVSSKNVVIIGRSNLVGKPLFAILSQKFDIASKTSVANYSFFLGATPDNFSEIANMQDNCGLKIFMGSSTGDLLVESDAALDEIFKRCNKVIAIHSEDEAILQKIAKEGIGENFTDHPKARPVEAAVTSTVKAINLALKYNKRLQHEFNTSGTVDVNYTGSLVREE